jgi:hypothetical protein
MSGDKFNVFSKSVKGYRGGVATFGLILFSRIWFSSLFENLIFGKSYILNFKSIFDKSLIGNFLKNDGRAGNVSSLKHMLRGVNL